MNKATAVTSTYRIRGLWIMAQAVFLAFILFCCSKTLLAAPTLTIPQVPLIMSNPIHPQVLILIANSQSMDGNLSGAIMTGSGALSSALTSLDNSSSPENYAVPAGFTPPAQAADASGNAPYTVTQSGNLVDNGPSRLNNAKAGITAILNAYMGTTDFGLATYNTSGTSVYNTYVYYMSPPGANFSYTNTMVSGNQYVTNPCYQYLTASSTVKANCTSMAAISGSSNLQNNLYIQVDSSSDDRDINDVLYVGSGYPGVFLTYSGPSPATPFPPNFSLANYNSGGVLIRYAKTSSSALSSFGTSPTNAGYVPYSPQVIYSQRGFGYYGSQSATSGTIRVPMTSAGTSPTIASVATAISAFTNFLKPETNSSATTEIKAIATQSPTAGLLNQANTYMVPLATTSGGGCPQKKYVILISDGLPTEDLSDKSWPPLGSAAAQGYGVTATFNTDGSLKTTNNQALTDAINKIKTLSTNGIPTFVIGLGAGVDSSLNPQAAASLTAMAVAGGTGNYYPATSPTALVTSLNTILISIQNGAYDISAAAVSSTQINGGTVEYQASFVSNDVPYQDWTGNLTAIQLDPTTGSPTTTKLWQAQPLLDNLVSGLGWQNTRIIATWNPTANDGVPFVWTSLSTAQKALLQPSDTLGANRVQYLRGNTALEQRNGGVFRNRTHILGDIVNSQGAYVGAPNQPYLIPSYVAFAKAQANRQPMLYVGSNDGLLHAFKAVNGVEAFAFIPNAVIANLDNLTATTYNQSHLYFVDASPQSSDVQFSDSSWHTLVVGGENAGGNSIYALDVTNPLITTETTLASKVLWEFTDSDMGFSYSQPQIAPIGLSTASPLNFAIFFGNGYNNPNNKSVLYAVNPQTGAIIKKIDLCAAVSGACDPTLPQGLSNVASANNNGLQTTPVTHVYAGDLQGNLWSVDVSNSNPASWTVRLLFQARTSAGAIQPITTSPVVTLHPNYPRYQGLFVMVGTGQLLTSADLLTTQTQTVYGVWDKPAATTTYLRSNLQAQTLTIVNSASSGFTNSILTATTNAVNWVTNLGWYIDLAVGGQRVITNPNLVNKAFIATINTPPLAICGVGFTSSLLELNFATGGAFNQPILDLNGDGKFTAADQYNGVYAVGVSISNNYSTAPIILGPNKNGYLVILITQSNGFQTAIINPNSTPRKTGWWEIQ